MLLSELKKTVRRAALAGSLCVALTGLATADVVTRSFQHGSKGYEGCFDRFVSDTGTDDADGADVAAKYLDGYTKDSSPDVQYPDLLTLFKFDGIFGTGEGQAPADVPVAKAWLVMTTGHISDSCRSVGPYSAYTMLREWDMASLHSSFGEVNGLQIGDDDISEALDTQDGFIRGAEVWFDVTEYVEGVRTGADDHGIAVQGDGTSDGWQIHATGSTEVNAHPRLVVYSGDIN